MYSKWHSIISGQTSLDQTWKYNQKRRRRRRRRSNIEVISIQANEIHSMWREIFTKFSDLWDAKIEKKVHAKDNNHTRKYLRDLSICLHLRSCKDFIIFRKKYKMRQFNFLSQEQHKTLISKTTFFLFYGLGLSA